MPFVSLEVILFSFRPVTSIIYLIIISLTIIQIQYIITLWKMVIYFLAHSGLFGAAATYLLNIRSNSMEPRADSELF